MEGNEECEVLTGQSPELDAKDERNVSWRVPNSPKQHDIVDEPALKVDSPKERILPTTERSVTPRSESNPSSPYEGRRATRIAKTTSDNSSDEPKNNSTSKLWRHLFAGVTRSVDELYVYCEELEDTMKCQEVIDLLKRSRLDFKKLSERIDEQSNVPQGQALSWDIRKPTLPSPSNPNGIVLGYSNPNSHRASPVLPDEVTMDDAPVLHAPCAQTESVSMRVEAELAVEKKKKLNPEAKPFSPAILSNIFPTPPATAMVAVIDPAVAPMLPPAVVDPGSAGKASVPTRSARVRSSSHKNQPSTSNLRPGPPGLEHHRVDGSSRSLFDEKSVSREEEELEDARLQAEVLQASEQVWAAAEAWVEAEAAAEEQEWQTLALGIKSYLYQHQHSSGGLSDYDYDDEPIQYPATHSLSLLGLGLPSSSASAHNSPKQFPGMGGPLGGAAAEGVEWGGNAFLLSPEQRAIWEEQPSPRSGIHRPGSAFQNRSRTGSRNNLLAPMHTPKASASTKKAHPSRITIETTTSHSPQKTSPGLSQYLSPNGANHNNHSYRSPSQSPTDFYLRSGGTPASGGRSLHDKLSSPDRKKARSPTELQRKIEERHNNAEMLRDKTVAERVQKASIASQRVKQAEEREAQRISEKKQIIEDKQLAAQERLQANLRQIQERANQEISKVNEVLFNKDLNKEAMAQKLEEAETRVMAASARRQERLQNLTLDQKRRNARKAQQLSEWRLQFEKENMDRWDKLQQRLDEVSARRAARLIELQRRADEKLLGNETGAAGAAVASGATASSDVAPIGKAAATSSMFNDTPTKAYLTHTSAEGERLISKLRKGVVSAQVAAKANPSGAITSPRTPLTSKRGAIQAAKKPPSPIPVAESVVPEDTQTNNQQRSKAKEKREKRKLKAQLIEQAEKADYAAIQEAIVMNSGINSVENATELSVSSAVAAASREKEAVITTEPSDAEKFVQSLRTFQRCPIECTEESFTVARTAQRKKVILAAKTELNRMCAQDVRGAQSAGEASGCLSREYTKIDTELSFVSAMQEDSGVNAPNLLALVVKDLLSAASATASAASGTTGSDPSSSPSSLNMHVMQRLFVLLETVPSVSTTSPTKASSTIATATTAVSNSSTGVSESLLCEVMLLRMLFGPEVGVLSSSTEYHTLLEAIALQHCNHNPLWRGTKESLATAQVTQELEVKAEVWTLVFNLLNSCAETSAGAGLILQSGLGAILVDLLHVLLKSLEIIQSTEGVYPTALTYTAANLLSVLSKLFNLTPCESETETDKAQTIGLCSQASVDAFVWYVFASAQVPAVVDLLKGITLRWEHSQSYHYLSTTSAEQRDKDSHVLAVCVDFIVAAAGYLSSVHDFIGRSGGLVEPSASAETLVVESVPQLSPATHRHSKGRQLVSLLRRAEMLPAVLGLLRALLSCDVFHLSTAEVASTTESAQASKAVLVDSLLVLGRLIDVAHSLVRADRSLGQGRSAEQQGQWVESVGTLLAHFQYALDGPPQALFPAQYTGRGALPALQLQKCDLEHTLRRALTTLSLMCLQNGPMQKLCGATSPPGTGVSGGKKSLMAQICSWTPKYFKNKRFKHAMLPCLISLCLDSDGNVLQLQRLGKLSTALKYLEYSVKTREVYLQQQQRRKGELDSALTEEALHVHRLSHLLPMDLWSIALVTLSQHEPQP